MSGPQFLDLKSYRRKRLVDTAKLLPVLGAVLVLFPLPFLFVGPSGAFDAGLGATALALYFFFVWLALILLGMVLVRVLGRPVSGD